MNLNNIPEELRQLRQWVVWREDKHPRNSITRRHASTNDPSTWSSYDDAANAVLNHKATGVGFVFSEEDEYAAVDLDKVINADGQMDPEAQEIIDHLDSYTEVSKSGRGIHIIVKGRKPDQRCRKGNIEIYDRGRYFALTGDLWQDRRDITERQEELEWLSSDVFDDQIDARESSEAGVTINADADPPADKLQKLCKSNEGFRHAWGYADDSLASMSDYDWRLAILAADDGWSDQEITNLIIAFRRTNGGKEDVAKSLRPDYIPRTLNKVRGSEPSKYLKMLPFTVVRLLKHGEQDAEYDMEIENNGETRSIQFGPTESFLSPHKAKARLYEAEIAIDDKVMRHWDKITSELLSYMERVNTVTRNDTTEAWLNDYVSSRISLPHIDKEEDIGEIFGSGLNSMAVDQRGHLFLRLSDVTRYVRVHTGTSGISTRTVAHDLSNLGFAKRSIYIVEGGRNRQISLWVSPAEYIRPSTQMD